MNDGPVRDLPFVDEPDVFVASQPGLVWRALVEILPRSSFGHGKHLGVLLRATPARAAGVFPDAGAALAGFEVAESVPGSRLRLVGHHRFATYSLTFTLEARGTGTRLSARTDAAFPGQLGRLYRAVVIGSGAHRILVDRLLRAVRQRAAGFTGQPR